MPLIVEDTSKINVPPECLPEYRLHMTRSSRPFSILHIKAYVPALSFQYGHCCFFTLNLLQTEKTVPSVRVCTKVSFYSLRSFKNRIDCYTYIPCFSFLCWFTSFLYFSSPVFFSVDHSGGLPVDSGEDV